MNQELIKHLKDSGFPIKVAFTDIDLLPTKDGNSIYYRPTLSELIEACGDKFECLYRIVNPDLSLKHWQCHGFGIDSLPSGGTAEDAVAELWLSINKK